VLLEPFEELPKSRLGGAKCLVQTKGTRSVFRLMNPTAIDVTVKRNQLLGYTHLVDLDKVQVLTDCEDNDVSINLASTSGDDKDSKTS